MSRLLRGGSLCKHMRKALDRGTSCMERAFMQGPAVAQRLLFDLNGSSGGSPVLCSRMVGTRAACKICCATITVAHTNASRMKPIITRDTKETFSWYFSRSCSESACSGRSPLGSRRRTPTPRDARAARPTCGVCALYARETRDHTLYVTHIVAHVC